MPEHQNTVTASADRPGDPILVRWSKRLAGTKVTVTTVIIFIAVLALLSLASAGVGYLAHHART